MQHTGPDMIPAAAELSSSSGGFYSSWSEPAQPRAAPSTVPAALGKGTGAERQPLQSVL